MDNKEFKRMSRRELVELIYAMKKNEMALQEKIAELEKKLEDRTIMMANTGSIAEAAMAVNKVFEAAQAAADAYLHSIQTANADAEKYCKEAEQERKMLLEYAQKDALEILEKAERQRKNVLEKANKEAFGIIQDAESKRKLMLATADEEARRTIEAAHILEID